MNSTGRGNPLIFHPVIFFTGMASGIAFHIWFRMYTTLFGIHQFSIASIMATMLFCLTLGSLIGGRLADKIPYRLALFAVLQAIFCGSTLFNTFFFGFLQKILANIILHFHPASFEMGFIRIALSFLFLFLPIASLGAILPVLGRYFTPLIHQSGNRISSILSASSTGIAAGLLLSGFCFIPGSGMRYALHASSVMSFLILVFTGVYLFFERRTETTAGHPVSSEIRKKHKAMLFRKSKPVLETGAKLTRAMLRVHAVNGFVSASFLILACRMITNYTAIGMPYLYILIFAVYFAGLALGSGFYKLATSRMVNGYLLMASLEFLCSIFVLLSLSLFLFCAPVMLSKAENSTSWWNTIACQLLPVISFILLPAFVTGLLLPLAGRIYPRRMLHLGRNIGKLGTLYYNGAIAGVLVTPFILLPLFGSVYSCLVLILTPLLSGFYLLYKDSRLIRGFRISYTLMTIAGITGILFMMVKWGWISSVSDRNSETIRKMQEGSSARVSLIEKEKGLMSLKIDGIENLETGMNGMLNQQLPAFLSLIFNPKIHTSLVIGFGMGLTASALEACNIPVIHVTEVYPEAMTLSSEAFSDENNDIITSSHLDIHIEDARLFLFRNSGGVDLILSGYADIHNVPGFFTEEFFQRCFTGLTDSGMIAQVLPLRGIDGKEFRSVIKACTGIFPRVSLWYLSNDKVLLMAFKKEADPDFCTIAARFRDLDKDGKFGRIGVPDVGSLLARKLMINQDLKGLAAGITANSDDRPLVEFSRTGRFFTDTVFLSKFTKSFIDPEAWIVSAAPCLDENRNILTEMAGARTAMEQELLPGKSIP